MDAASPGLGRVRPARDRASARPRGCGGLALSEPDLGPVNGVLIWTEAARFEALRSFYVETLGLTPRADRPQHVDFEWGEMRLTIVVHEEVEGPSCDPLRLMINFAVDDIEATYERLREAGVTFSRPPEREPWGGLIATFADPDGNTLQLMQLPQAPA